MLAKTQLLWGKKIQRRNYINILEDKQKKQFFARLRKQENSNQTTLNAEFFFVSTQKPLSSLDYHHYLML